ncbi:hypothetical protein SDC9_98241 [bioreactor metagenome]|uniref:Uncharacterized protein n=1 Tax=bioreactor metagenome TaxID=1076179 RepID=A0A645AE67_9ZZZZ
MAGKGLPLQRVGGDLHRLTHFDLADIQFVNVHFKGKDRHIVDHRQISRRGGVDIIANLEVLFHDGS